MRDNDSKITGILLAGGMSRRMGTEKGNLRIGNSLLYEYPLGILEGICDEILISTCHGSAIPVKHRKVCDEVKGIGPLGGIYSSLKTSANDLTLILSYDMPMVNESLFRLLISKGEGYDIVLPAMQKKRPEPLCGLYRKSMISITGQMIEQNDLAVNHLLLHCKSKIVTIHKEMECWLPDLFLNINTREDLDRIPPGFGIEQDEK
jgi:molybdopterin-guanine dinucleotide biosynthesis protein A